MLLLLLLLSIVAALVDVGAVPFAAVDETNKQETAMSRFGMLMCSADIEIATIPTTFSNSCNLQQQQHQQRQQ